MTITKTIWIGSGDATKAYDECGCIAHPRLVGYVMSLSNLDNGDISVTKENECDGFTIYSVTAPSSVWDEWEGILMEQGYL